MPDITATSQTILVVGGGISGVTAALEAAECGKDVILIEKGASLGGRVARLYKYFPKLCRPSCGYEINLRRVKACRNLRVLTMAEIESVSGVAGNYTAAIKIHPRYVNENCTACGECEKAVSATIPDPHHYGMSKIKAAYLPHHHAYPQRYVLDSSIVKTKQGAKAKAACRYDAIDLEMREQTLTINCGAVIFATGWRPYDAAKIQPYGYDRYADVITSVEFERMMDPLGPTGGKLLRPSNKKAAKDIAFIQCAGSRDHNHLAHCSRICCMASLKQATYLGECYGDDSAAKATIYYIDIRTIDRFEDFERKVRNDKRVHFVKSKVAAIEEDAKTKKPVVCGVDTHGYKRYANAHDLVVLAVGMQPSIDVAAVVNTDRSGDQNIAIDSGGFIELTPAGYENGHGNVHGNGHANGIFGAGCASAPLDVNRSVQSATAAALRAIQVVNQTAKAA